MAEVPIWGIHAGRTGDADSLFLQSKVVAIGWEEFGDLTKWKTREEFKSHYLAVYSQSKPGVLTLREGCPQ